MSDDPTLAEVARLVTALTVELKEFRATYLPREVWNAMHQADAAVIADLATDIRGCKDSTKVEINRVETKVDNFNAEYDADRKHDAEIKRQEQQQEKTRRQGITLAVVGLAVTNLTAIVIAVLAYVGR